MFFEERNNNLRKIFPITHLIPIAILMVHTTISLKIYISAAKESFELIKNVSVFLYKLEIESRLYPYSSLYFLLTIWISYVRSKTPFPIY